MKKRVIILIISLIAITGIIVGVSYAFFSTGGMQQAANTFQSGCLNISLTDASSSINLSNIYPVTDIEGLDGTSYDFTIKNTCSTDANYQINLESIQVQKRVKFIGTYFTLFLCKKQKLPPEDSFLKE